MLKIIGIDKAEFATCIVKINSYVPITFRSRDQPVPGARYVRLGDLKACHFELQFPSDTSILTGFTLTSCRGPFGVSLNGHGPSSKGLPIFELPEQAFSGRLPRIDMQAQISLSCTNNQTEIRIGEAKTFDRVVVHERVQFLFLRDVLVGLRVLDLAAREEKTLSGYLAEHQS